jgi:Fe-S cluster biogenesis protein NfuA
MSQHQISIVATKHPGILKFESNQFISPNKNYEFNNIDEAVHSPLAQQLFFLPFVKTVYLASNFIGIQKFDMVEWSDVQEEVAKQLEDYLNSGEPVVIETTKEPVTVYIENTPNPSVMKFVSNKPLVQSVFEYKNIDEATDSPLAKELFMLPFVKEVFMDLNYISITKFDVADWEEIGHELRQLISDYLNSDKQVVSAPKQQSTSTVEKRDLDETSAIINQIINDEIKPAVASDGGNIVFESYDSETKKVQVILQGACSGCPSSTFTLKNGIESMLKNMLGDKISEVVAING